MHFGRQMLIVETSCLQWRQRGGKHSSAEVCVAMERRWSKIAIEKHYEWGTVLKINVASGWKLWSIVWRKHVRLPNRISLWIGAGVTLPLRSATAEVQWMLCQGLCEHNSIIYITAMHLPEQCFSAIRSLCRDSAKVRYMAVCSSEEQKHLFHHMRMKEMIWKWVRRNCICFPWKTLQHAYIPCIQ